LLGTTKSYNILPPSRKYQLVAGAPGYIRTVEQLLFAWCFFALILVNSWVISNNKSTTKFSPNFHAFCRCELHLHYACERQKHWETLTASVNLGGLAKSFKKQRNNQQSLLRTRTTAFRNVQCTFIQTIGCCAPASCSLRSVWREWWQRPCKWPKWCVDETRRWAERFA